MTSVSLGILVEAIMISIGSSTDNMAVGVSLGVSADANSTTKSNTKAGSGADSQKKIKSGHSGVTVADSRHPAHSSPDKGPYRPLSSPPSKSDDPNPLIAITPYEKASAPYLRGSFRAKLQDFQVFAKTCYPPIFKLNLIIAICNGLGALFCSFLGRKLTEFMPVWFDPGWLAAMAFLYYKIHINTQILIPRIKLGKMLLRVRNSKLEIHKT
jgi:hypothetical protein